MTVIAVVDYGMGNLRSVRKALEHVGNGAVVEVTSAPERILRADRVVLPGVGAIGDCMNELHRLELVEALREAAGSKPFLGVCLGMQALLDFSEENQGVDCLGVLPGKARRFPAELTTDAGLKVPHMGWNGVLQQGRHPLWRGIADNSRFYFVHSYYVEPAEAALAAGVTRYGFDFAAVVARGNVFATQFHPEKSQRAGLDLLANFVRWDGSV
ncbi:imidazole glycerol phosphate synthase subunit HisH [Alkalilimnicola ehrlichii]|uniref:Imidazole glycerol phosphate synthase subunit HisH n=1 Tax=Alkalilimnicola ehrlichii TaxID=351052 RepID=A0A3E0WIF5_9GAMM|nr:imidazole glycerol phosphate synthase subunit HisH [Alkalilimnicola ehrlichii]RFA24767.1 imidazole glycerol phosphate synthase subunit HisH [Alkalilimnicola ehrlichii]RFA32003.1 imidazole glycerol phosphate synthase subunit HisH [Alkalilimnicola ehrlichii]